MMEWPFPIAETQPGAASERQYIVSSVEAYASTDRTFAHDLEHDDDLKLILQDLKHGIDRDEVAFQIGKRAIVRGFLTRADFAAEQKLFFREKMKEAKENKDGMRLARLQADIEAVEEEVKNTLEILEHFQKILSPYLDLSVEILKGAMKNVNLHAFTNEESVSETDNDDDSL